MNNEKYLPRLIDSRVTAALNVCGGVMIVGPKWCGKSRVALDKAASEVLINVPENRQRALIIPDAVLEGAEPKHVAEWQDAPVLWDAAQQRIAAEHRPGMFIFTGSAVPDIPEERKLSHGRTERFAKVRMRTLSLYEQGASSGEVSLSALFARKPFQACISDMDFMKALQLICKGGWPASFRKDESDPRMLAHEYLGIIIDGDISRMDGIKRDPTLVRLFARALARNCATAVKTTKLRADIAEKDGADISEQTLRSYYDALKRIFMIEEQDAWRPSPRSKNRVRITPRKHFADPSLAAAALDATPEVLSEDIKTAGLLFKSLCFRDFSVYMDVLDGRVYHYRDKDGLEIDAILQLQDGRWGAVEVVLGTFEFDAAAAKLLRLKTKLADEVQPPAFLGIVTATGKLAWQRDDGAYVLPIDCLAP